MSIYDRVNYYKLGSDKKGEPSLDLLVSDWQAFRDNIIGGELHTVNQEEENDLPLISYKFYETVELWWVIAQYNNIVNPLADVPVGLELRIPTKESVDRELRQLALANDRLNASETVTLQRRTV